MFQKNDALKEIFFLPQEAEVGAKFLKIIPVRHLGHVKGENVRGDEKQLTSQGEGIRFISADIKEELPPLRKELRGDDSE